MANHDLTEIGKYHIQDLVGEGAMGVVYRALDPVLNRHVAIKVMSDALARDEVLRDRFLREARAAGSLQHPNVITIYDFGEVDGHLYIAMEFVEGSDLDTLLRSGTPLSLDEKLSIMTDVLNGLGYAHKRGVVHRDIKPANVRVDEDGHARIMDFGIAHLNSAMTKMTRTGMMLGTPNYMAPEQITGEEISPRTDIFAAGALLYELLTNTRPFQADTLHAVLYKITSEPPPSLRSILPGLPAALDDIVMRALAKDPARRYSTALEMSNELTRVRQTLSHAPQASMSLHATIEHARTSGRLNAGASQPKKADRRRVAYIGGGVVMLAAILAVTTVWAKRGTERENVGAPASLQGTTTAPASSSAGSVSTSPSAGAPASVATVDAPATRVPSGAQKQSATNDAARNATPAGPTQAELDLVQSAKSTASLARDRARVAGVATDLLAPGDEHDRQGDDALRRGQIRTALQHYQAAGNAWSLAVERAQQSTVAQRESPRPTGASSAPTPNATTSTPAVNTPTIVAQPPVSQAPPSSVSAPVTSPAASVAAPSANPQAEISAVIAAYGRAIDSRDVDELRRAYPGITRDQLRAFQDFFSRTRSLHATFRVGGIDVDGATAEARFTGVYEFVTSVGRSERQNVSLMAMLRRDASGWKLTSIR